MIYDPYITPKRRDPFTPYYGYRKRREREKKFLKRIFFGILILFIFIFGIKLIYKPVYGIFINENLVFCIKGKKEALKILEKIEKEKTKGYKSFRYKDKVEVKRVKGKTCDVSDLKEVYEKLKKEIGIEVKTKVLKIDGRDILAGDEKVIKECLEEIKNKYRGFHQESLGKINFKEKVNLYERFVKVENVKKKEEILKILTGSKEVNYVVKKGDLGNTIAKKFAINLNVLKMENPDVNFDNLKIGETIKIKNKPVLTVVTQKLLIKREKIPPQILKISTNRLPKGTQEIREKGETGEKEKVILLTYENGKLANQELLKETILKKPTYRVIVKGVRE